MADTTIFALLGSLLVALTLLPVSAPGAAAAACASGATSSSNGSATCMHGRSTGASRTPWHDDRARWSIFALALAADRRSSAPSSCPTWTRARSGCGPRCPRRSPSRNRRKISPQIRAILRSFPEVTVVASEHGRPDDGTDPTGFFNAEFFVGLKPYARVDGSLSHQGGADRGDQREAVGVPGHPLQLHPAGRGRRGRGGDRPQELAGREDLRSRSGDAREARATRSSRCSNGVRGIDRDHASSQELGQPSLTVDGRPRQDRALRPQRRPTSTA